MNAEEKENLRREAEIRFLSGIMTGIESIIQRQRKVDDPIVRNSMLLDKLLTVIDIGFGMLMAYTDRGGYPDEFQNRITDLFGNIQTELESLLKWVQHPQYSPDHSFGKVIMTKSETDYVKSVHGCNNC